ncbi:predicted protein [Streptomyces viridosporus ATCC 14672]|uniref:Predicted protein n=1 Tax=Streptomyces viridosporus (strain ATCC 14672 / DSM 40746 / JCM 4963 / KCTC 9882 / NRRL B-12104 / FH 1290) TaxID=566461 RepID=D5ZWA2_STRV1|nr:predicted protein [Streptomyces viridosporus ATCC 14672]
MGQRVESHCPTGGSLSLGELLHTPLQSALDALPAHPGIAVVGTFKCPRKRPL